MYYYTAYGLDVHSDIKLPELCRVSGVNGKPDITITHGDVSTVPESVQSEWIRRVEASPNQCRVSYDSYGTFLVEDGNKILFDSESDDAMAKRETRHLLETQILALLLHQRGRLVLHGSAVSVNGNTAIFIGPSGVGKSTIAAAVHEKGYEVLEDDVISIRFDGGVPIIDSGIPVLRLPTDTVDDLELDSSNLQDDKLSKNKNFLQFNISPKEHELDRCYTVTTGDDFNVSKIKTASTVLQLISNTYVKNYLTETESQSSNFTQCSTVAENVSFRMLSRPKEMDNLKTYANKVIADINNI